REIQAGEGCRVEQRPGREQRPAAEDEPHLVTFPHGLYGFQQRAPLLVAPPDEAKRRGNPQIEPVHDGEPDQQPPEDRPPDQPQSYIVGHGNLRFTPRQPGAAPAAASNPVPRVRGGSCAPAGTRRRPPAPSRTPRTR